MNDISLHLSENKYVVVPNFLGKDVANNLSSDFKLFLDKNPHLIKSDAQVPGARGLYNYIPFTQVLVERTRDVGLLINEPVLPTYCYAREYKRGSKLGAHTDIPPCEVSLSVHLSGDHQWPLFFTGPSGNKIEVNLEVGDAIIYYGQAIEHGRDENPGDDYIQLFLHYVRSDGEHSNKIFDAQRRDQRAVLKFVDGYFSDPRLNHSKHKNIIDFLQYEKNRLLVLWGYYKQNVL